jgi:hypothetical protein
MVYDEMIDNASFGHCRACGDEIGLQKVTREQVQQKAREVDAAGGRCDYCVEGSTAFDKQARFQIVQWLGPVAYKQTIASVVEPPNASYAVVTLRMDERRRSSAEGNRAASCRRRSTTC